jgi:hypothetical protein
MNGLETQPPVTIPERDGNDPTAYSRRDLGYRLHRYKRFAPQNASDAIGNILGVREYIVGTSGVGLGRQEGSAGLSRVLMRRFMMSA